VGKQFPGSLFSVLSGLGWVFGFCLFGLNLRHLFFAGGWPNSSPVLAWVGNVPRLRLGQL